MLDLHEAPVRHEGVGKIKQAPAPRYPIAVTKVAERVKALGGSARALEVRGGLSHSFIADLLEGRKRSVNGQDRLNALAKALACAPAYLTAPDCDSPRPRVALPGIVPLAGTVAEGVVRAECPPAALPTVPVAPDARFPGAQAVYSVGDATLEGIGAPKGAWLLTVDARDFVRQAGAYRAGQLVVVALTGKDGVETVVRRVVVFADRVELQPVTGAGTVYTLGRPARGRRLDVRGVVLKAIQELA